MPANKRIIAIASLATAVRASNSDSVDDVVIVSYLPNFQATGPPNRVIKYPCEDFRSLGLSANEALV